MSTDVAVKFLGGKKELLWSPTPRDPGTRCMYCTRTPAEPNRKGCTFEILVGPYLFTITNPLHLGRKLLDLSHPGERRGLCACPKYRLCKYPPPGPAAAQVPYFAISAAVYINKQSCVPMTTSRPLTRRRSFFPAHAPVELGERKGSEGFTL